MKLKILLPWLMVADIAMSVTATYVDRYEFLAVPWYLFPFVPICPLYPLLIAVILSFIYRNKTVPQPLLHFTLIGIVGYGAMAFVFYPMYMADQGFGWYEFGNILWVTLYAAQSFLLFPHTKKISAMWYALFVSYFITKDILDRFGNTFSYQRDGMISEQLGNTLFASIIVLHMAATVFVAYRQKQKQ